MRHRIEVLGSHGHVEGGGIVRNRREGNPNDVVGQGHVRESGAEVIRDSKDAATIVEQDPVDDGDRGQGAVGHPEFASAPRPDPAMADHGRRQAQCRAHRNRLEDRQFGGADDPPTITLAVPRSIESERFGVAPGDVLSIPEQRAGPNQSVGARLVEPDPIPGEIAVVDAGDRAMFTSSESGIRHAAGCHVVALP